MRPVLVLLPHDDEHAAHAALLRFNDAHKQAARPLEPVTQWGRDIMHAVTKDQGFSLHDAIGDAPHTGYMVCLDKTTEKVIPLRDLRPEDIADYRDSHAAELRDPNVFLGGWVWKGKVYLDLSYHFADLDAAMQAARTHRQIGIYDLAKGETLVTADYFAAKDKAAVLRSYFTKEASDLAVVNALRAQGGLEPLSPSPHDHPSAIARAARLRIVKDS